MASTARSGDSPQANTYVKVDISFSQNDLKAGETGKLLIFFTPQDEIHITTDPPMRFALTSSELFVLGERLVPTDTATGYVDTSQPVVQDLQVKTIAIPGKATLKGTLTYYFCSDSEGWCRRFNQPVELDATISR
jgi:hypothetical protein